MRNLEHYKECDQNSRKPNWMRRHIEEEHEQESDNCEFTWKIISTFKKPMRRQLTEAVYINNTREDEILNLKNEYFSNEVKGVTLNSRKYVTCKECAGKFENMASHQIHFKMNHERLKCSECDYLSYGKRDSDSHFKRNHVRQQ